MSFLAPLIMLTAGALVVGCFIAHVVLNLVILIEMFQALARRRIWYPAAVLVFFSILMGLFWGVSLDRLQVVSVLMFLTGLIPVVKFCRCWNRNSMPRNKIYATTLKIAFLPCCVLFVFGTMLVWSILTAKFSEQVGSAENIGYNLRRSCGDCRCISIRIQAGLGSSGSQRF